MRSVCVFAGEARASPPPGSKNFEKALDIKICISMVATKIICILKFQFPRKASILPCLPSGIAK